jgi:hypothetical protein
MAITLEENIQEVSTRIKQIVTYDIAGREGDAPEAYKVNLLMKCFRKLQDGKVVNECTKRYSFKIGDLLYSETEVDGEIVKTLIPERQQLMSDFMGLFYEEMAKVDALEEAQNA